MLVWYLKRNLKYFPANGELLCTLGRHTKHLLEMSGLIPKAKSLFPAWRLSAKLMEILIEFIFTISVEMSRSEYRLIFSGAGKLCSPVVTFMNRELNKTFKSKTRKIIYGGLQRFLFVCFQLGRVYNTSLKSDFLLTYWLTLKSDL